MDGSFWLDQTVLSVSNERNAESRAAFEEGQLSSCCIYRAWKAAFAWPLHAFLCKGYLYSLHHILSGPSIFSRIFSNIENILTSRRSTETKSRSKPAQNLQNLKISVGIDPKPTVEGGIAVSSSLVKTVLDAAQRQRQEYSRISLDSRSTKVKGCGKLVYS